MCRTGFSSLSYTVTCICARVFRRLLMWTELVFENPGRSGLQVLHCTSSLPLAATWRHSWSSALCWTMEFVWKQNTLLNLSKSNAVGVSQTINGLKKCRWCRTHEQLAQGKTVFARIWWIIAVLKSYSSHSCVIFKRKFHIIYRICCIIMVLFFFPSLTAGTFLGL